MNIMEALYTLRETWMTQFGTHEEPGAYVISTYAFANFIAMRRELAQIEPEDIINPEWCGARIIVDQTISHEIAYALERNPYEQPSRTAPS